ncbi:thioredoxin-like protein [Boletus coccyginus]|nr:thioredoxin-like protein [Boletus coccyginus]
MMNADIEHLVLSGKLFGTDTGSSSPARTPSPSLSFESTDAFDDEKRRRDGTALDTAYESIGMGPGRTGVKGVIRDQHEAQAIQAAKREKEIEALRKRMERGNLGGKTFLEEEREKRALEGREEGDVEDDLAQRVRRDILGRPKEGPFGHLREVGRAGFVAAVENEERGVWVVIHLYESSLDRCYTLDDTLSKLARLYPQTKFLRARAAALGFASKGPTKQYASRQQSMPGRFIDNDDDNPYYDDEEEKTPYYDEEEDEEEDVDTDMLPTLLVYRDGELVHNWVRVDWEAGKAGVEELLSSRHIITDVSASGNGNCGLPSDEEDLVWSDEEAIS